MSKLIKAALLCLGLAVPAVAAADVLPGCGANLSGLAECNGKKAADPCTFANGTSGNCATLRCVNDAGQAQLQCVATGVPQPATGCSAVPGAVGQSASAGLLLALLGLGAALRRRRG